MSFEDIRPAAFVLARLTTFMSHALLFGLVPMLLVVLRPMFATLEDRRWRKARWRIVQRIEQLVRLSLVLAALASVASISLQASVLAELGEGGTLFSSLSSVLKTSFGQWYLLRLALSLALAVILVGRVKRECLRPSSDVESAPQRAWWLTWTVLSLMLLVSISLSGHAATNGLFSLRAANDVLHLAASSTWFTGILVLAAVVPLSWRDRGRIGQIQLLTPAIVRFSNLAFLSISVAAITGVINSYLNLGAVNDLTDTPYGRSLFIKLLIFGLVLGLGGLNHYAIRRRLQHAQIEKTSTLAKDAVLISVAFEAAAALAIMAVTAALVGLPKTS